MNTRAVLLTVGVIFMGATIMGGFAGVGNSTADVFTRENVGKTAAIQKTNLEIHKVKKFYMQKNPRLWEDLAEDMAEVTVDAAEAHKLQVKVLAGVIGHESVANPFAKSSTGAAGMGQVDFEAHKERFPHVKEERDKYDPANNIRAAAELLSYSIKKHGVNGGLQAYNIGEESYQIGKRNPRFVRKVNKCIDQFIKCSEEKK